MNVGIDSIEISRIEKSLENKGFLEKVFSAEEIEFFNSRNMRAESIAANFAAKEAFSKALATGIRGFSLNEISVLRDGLGAPYIKLSGKALEAAKGLRFKVSITHTKTVASAIVLAIDEVNV
mgnify:FL=1